jgi:hypothetical protein
VSNLTAEQRTFDSWFSSQPFPKQAEMRRLGVIPYREMPQDRYVFEVRPNSAAYRFDPIDDELRKEDDTFVSRERLREIVGRILDTLARSPDRTVRLHIELVRIALRTPDSLSYGDICSHYSMTRQGVHYRVKEMRRVLSGIAPRPLSPAKESPHGGGAKRVAAHRSKKTGVNRRKTSVLAKGARRP